MKIATNISLKLNFGKVNINKMEYVRIIFVLFFVVSSGCDIYKMKNKLTNSPGIIDIEVGEYIKKSKTGGVCILHTRAGDIQIDLNCVNDNITKVTPHGCFNSFLVNLDSCIYNICYNDKYIDEEMEIYVIRYIETYDVKFVSREGCFIGMKLEEALKKTDNKPYLFYGWGYYPDLENDWFADFGLSELDTNKINQDSVIRRFIKS